MTGTWPTRVGQVPEVSNQRHDNAGGMEVAWLGSVDYGEALELQRRLAGERSRGERPDTLLLMEHPDVITVGRSWRGPGVEGAAPHAGPVYVVERGGGATYHGPGQLVGYPVVHLRERGLTVGAYLRALEGALTLALRLMGISAARRPPFTGVWATAGSRAGDRAASTAEGRGPGPGTCRWVKLASIGIAVKGWVAYHGFALNVTTDLSRFHAMRPCGLDPSAMASIESLTGGAPDPVALRRRVAAEVSASLAARAVAGVSRHARSLSADSLPASLRLLTA